MREGDLNQLWERLAKLVQCLLVRRGAYPNKHAEFMDRIIRETRTDWALTQLLFLQFLLLRMRLNLHLLQHRTRRALKLLVRYAGGTSSVRRLDRGSGRTKDERFDNTH